MHTDLSPRLSAVFLVTILAAASTARSQTDITELAGLKARSIGPSGMSGRISAIDAVNADPNIIYVGAATGGSMEVHVRRRGLDAAHRQPAGVLGGGGLDLPGGARARLDRHR